VRRVLEEVQALYTQMREGMKENNTDPSLACPLMLYHVCILRNKRCLLAYLNHRTELLEEARWNSGSALPDDIKNKLCAEEMEYFSKYDALVSDYMYKVDFDLSSVSFQFVIFGH